MTATQYVKSLKKLGLTPYSAGPFIGVARRTSMRYASGSQAIPETVAKLIECYLSHGLPTDPDEPASTSIAPR